MRVHTSGIRVTIEWYDTDRMLLRFATTGPRGGNHGGFIVRYDVLLEELERLAAPPNRVMCSHCILRDGCIVQPFTRECKEYRREHLP